LTEIYPRTASANINSRGVSADKKKHQSVEFVFDYECDHSAWHNQRSAFFKAEAINLDSIQDGIYVELDKFWVKFDANNGEAHPHAIQSFMLTLKKQFGIDSPIIYGFKKKSVHKVANKKNWIPLADWAYKQMTDYLEANKYSQLIKDSEHLQAHWSYVQQKDVEVVHLVNNLRDCGRNDGRAKNFASNKYLNKIVVDNSLLKEYLVAWNEMRPTKEQEKALEVIGTVNKSNYSRELNIKISDKIDNAEVKSTHNLFELVERLLKRYPLLSHLDYRVWQTDAQEKLWTKIAEYANLVDVTVVTKNRK
jgi:hypothetical protein